jgi:outer membrane protein insertion porin family
MRCLKLLSFQIFMATLVFAKPSLAAKVKDLAITGLKRIEKASVLDKISFKPGDEVVESQVTQDVKALFETGFFYNIEVDFKNGILTYKLEEKPMVRTIVYSGNKAFDDEELSEELGVKSNELLDVKKINIGLEKIAKKYTEKGYYLVKTDYTTTEYKDGSQNLAIKISEGDKVKVRKINLLGNKTLSDKKIKSVMALKETGLFGMGGSFQKEALLRDKEVIAFIYQNEGFAQVQVDVPKVMLTEDKRSMVVNFYITEGEKFAVGDISFSGDVDFSEDELMDSIDIDEKDYFSREVLIKDIQTIQAKYGDLGYAYSNVSPIPKFNPDKTVDFDFRVNKGELVTIGEINVIGNSITRDKVVRRELRLFEGELYNETDKRISYANVRRLGFFDNVDFQQKVSDQRSDIMDIDINVEERSTGQLNIGAGYGGFQGFTLQGSIQQTNFMGYGINFGLNINYAERFQQLFNLNITDPYFRDTNYSLGFDAYRSLRFVIDYQDVKTGGSVTLGKRYGDYVIASLRYKFEAVRLDLNNDSFTDVFTPERIEDAEGISSGLTASITYDKRNDRMFPTDGYFARASLEQTGLGGQVTYTKAAANARFYQPIIGSLVWRNNLVYGWIGAPGDVPVNELYRLGGPNTVRGYDFFSIAQRETSQQAYNAAIGSGQAFPEAWAQIPVGGSQQLYYNLEFEWGLVKEAGIRGVVFFDAGLANNSIDLGELRTSYGFGVRWNSPMGPLRFEWGFPLDPIEEIGEGGQDFQFSIMQSF